MTTPRLRMFAGPNGSGKSTIKDKFLLKFPNMLGVYINPDDIHKEIASSGLLSFSRFKIKTNEADILRALRSASQLKDRGLVADVEKLVFERNALSFMAVDINAYFVSALADFLHASLVAARKSFAFETVMSHTAKIDLLKRAKAQGFRTYLYYVATEDPEINIARVRTRVNEGGHDVPREKIIERYYRSLEYLIDAIRASDRAYIFDNSATDSIAVAEITGGKDIEILNSNVPVWFRKYLLDKGTSRT
jgi:predicted ABC-type ATPase